MRQFRQYLCLENEQDWTENLGNFGWFWYEGGMIENKPHIFSSVVQERK